MSKTKNQVTVDIQPELEAIRTWVNLKYTSWHALAEFIDNSLGSFDTNIKKLKKVHGRNYKLEIKIEISAKGKGSIIISDNAAGISSKHYARAFSPGAPPPDTTDKHEFGMGMKTAGFWFSPEWTVRTCALGEPVERFITLELDKILTKKTGGAKIHPVERKQNAKLVSQK